MRLLLAILTFCLPCLGVELLIKAREAAHHDAKEDAVGRAKIGMVVEIRPDGAVYGKRECLPRFFVLKLPGVSRKDVEKYLATEYDNTGTNATRFRAWKLDVAKLPKATADALTKTGSVVVAKSDWTALKINMVQVATGTTETP